MDTTQIPPEFATLIDSWELSLRADGYAAHSVTAYLSGARSLALWAAENLDAAGPGDLQRDDVRAWLVDLRERRAASTARLRFTGVKSFYGWLSEEDEVDGDPTEGVKTPVAGEPQTPVLSLEDLRRLLGACDGKGFAQRRDAAILRVFLDSGLRLAELVGLQVDDVDLRERLIYVKGKGTRRSGPRHRVAPIGIRTTQALDRYLRERRKHTWATVESALWLGSYGSRGMTVSGMKALVARRGEQAGLESLYPHRLRHTWAHAFRADGGSEGDLMHLGGWRSRTQLDRYGSSAAGERAREAARKRSLGDQL